MQGIACRIAVVALFALGACAENGDGDANTGGSGGIGNPGGSGGGGGSGGNGGEPAGPVAGQLIGVEDPSAVSFTVVADADDGLARPRDIGFNPGRPGEAWIVNRTDDSVTIILDVMSEELETVHRIDGYAMHFMEEPSSLAFGAQTYKDDYTFGTCQESENTYNGQAEPNFFMGPALWSADPTIFAVENPIGLGSHIDMLHHSPNCMGIAHDELNVYWAFDGYNGKIVRYDFGADHDAGYDDHSDGIIHFFAEPDVLRAPGVPSHMELDHETGMLYVADTGNGRVLRVNTRSGEKVRNLPVIERGNTVEEWGGIEWTELVPASAGHLQKPSGLDLHDGTLYVSDNATGTIVAFDLEGNLIARLDTGLENGSLMGIEAGPDDRLYFTDARGQRVLRVEY